MPKRSERPTVPPSFDVAQYAKDSDARIVIYAAVEPDDERGAAAAPHSEMRLQTRPNVGAVQTDDAWARSMMGIPVVAISPERLKRLPLDHRAGFLLSCMDGTMDLENLLEVSAMPQNQALRLVRDLFESGVIHFR